MFPEYSVVEIDPQLAQQASKLSVTLPIPDDVSLRSRSSQLELSESFARTIPGWDALILKIRELVQLHGWALVRGFQFDQENRLSMGLAASFCVPIEPYNLSHTQMVQEIQNVGQGDVVETLHTDSTGWMHPNELTLMECVQPDLSGGGVSLIADINDIMASLSHQENVLATLREKPAPFKRDTSSGGEVFYAPVLSPSTWQQNRENVRFLSSNVRSLAVAVEGILEPELDAALSVFEATLATPGMYYTELLRKHDWLVLDNYRILHARTLVSSKSDRCIKRIKANWTENGDSLV